MGRIWPNKNTPLTELVMLENIATTPKTSLGSKLVTAGQARAKTNTKVYKPVIKADQNVPRLVILRPDSHYSSAPNLQYLCIIVEVDEICFGPQNQTTNFIFAIQ